ncbi:MAG: glycosyltransferase, partial [Pseudomonadota bacterium]
MTAPTVFHVQMGRDGGTERFFVTLAGAFAEAGARQGFALRGGTSAAAEVSSLGPVSAGPVLRRTPGGLVARARMARAASKLRPDAVLAWRAPAARVLPAIPGVVRLVRLGDYPAHTAHFAGLDAVICNNPGIAAHLATLGYTGRVEVISNFARPIGIAPVARDALGTPPGAFVVCGAARFAANKGLDTLVKAVAQVPDAWLWLVGD